MNIAELIYQEAQGLSEANAREVLDFVESLKLRSIDRPASRVDSEADKARRQSELLKRFARFQIDMTGFRFDREDANARR